jgi:hypothetical protein
MVIKAIKPPAAVTSTVARLNATIQRQRAAELLEAAARNLETARRVRQDADARFDEAEQAYLRAAFQARDLGAQVRGVTFTSADGRDMSVTLVDGTGRNSRLDDAKLMKKLGAALWGRVTRRVLDPTLLQGEIDRGTIDPAEVAGCMVVSDKKSYATFTDRTKPAQTKAAPTKVVKAA